MAVSPEVLPENAIRVLDHGFVRLDDAMATDLSVVNAARVSFARRKEAMDESDEGLKDVYEHAYGTYERLVEAGVARELARSVIPVGAYTEFFWTVNARALMNFVSLRAAETAQREIRRYAEACESFLGQRMPVTYDAFVKNGRIAP